MEQEGFTKREADALIGKTYQTVAELPNVPQGTRGIVVATDHVGSIWLVGIQWQLIPGRGRQSWLTKFELQKYTQEVPI
jgi:hypothetical protein